MIKCLGLDLETQGLEDNTKITEIGAIHYVWDGRFILPDGKEFYLEQFCYETDYPPQPQNIIKLTGITDEKLRHGGQPRRYVLKEMLFPMMDAVDIIFAHNVGFDKRILEATCKELGLLMPKKEWICTREDLDWSEFSCRKLQHLAIDHKIHFDPNLSHRATFDVHLMFKLLAKYKLEDLLAYARAPWVSYVADIKKPWDDNGVQKNIASSLGFKFDPITKDWSLRTKAAKLDSILKAIEESKSPFEIREVK